MGLKHAFALGSIFAIGAGLLAIEAPAPEPRTLALTGALIHTQTDAGSFVGTVIVRDGKIAAVGRDAAIPDDARRLDATNCVITPGLIDAHGSLSLQSGAAAESGRDASLNILDAVDPFAEDWRDAARQGVTAVYVQPSGNGTLGGSGAILRVGPAENPDALAIRALAAVQIALGTAPPAAAPGTNFLADIIGRRGQGGPQLPAAAPAPPPANTSLTRFAQYEQVRASFESAKVYGAGKPLRREPPKELLLRAIKGEIPVRIEIHYEDDLRNAQKLIAEFGLKAIYEHVERAKPLPDDFRSSRASLVVGPFLGVGASGELRKLALDGRKFAIATFGTESRSTAGLRMHAAAAVAAGYPRGAVLRALTRDAAELLGVGDRLGQIAVGRPADLVVFAGDPLDPSAPVRLTMSRGTITHSAPAAEMAPAPVQAKPDFPDVLAPTYTLKTTRLLNAAGEFVPGVLHIVGGILSPDDHALPAGTIDIGDAPVTPGLLAAHVAGAGENAPDADTSHLRAADGLAKDDSRLRACRDAGFLTVVVAPASNNVLAGLASTVRSDESIEIQDAGMKFVLTAAARHAERFPVSLAGQVELIDARLRGAPPQSDLYLPLPVRTALLTQRERALDAVRERRLTAFFEAQTRAEVRAALRLIADHKLRGVLLLPRDVDELVDEIRQSGVAVVVGPVKPQDAESVTRGLAALGQAGVPLALGGDAADLRPTAAWLVNAGLPRPAARRALLGESLGLPAGTARFSRGDAADFVVWTGDPLDIASRPVAVVAQGVRLPTGGGDDTKPNDPRRPTANPTRPRGRGR